MKVISLSASHRDLDLDLIDRLSLAAPNLDRAVLSRSGAHGVVVLATCNRLEIYAEVNCPRAAAAVAATLTAVADCAGLPDSVVRRSFTQRQGRAAAEHLFKVASGLESMIVGEREIVGQVARTLESAQVAGTTSPLLERLFQDAIRVSREVEAATGLGAHGRSVVSVGLDLVASHVDRWEVSSVLLIGTGKFAGAAAAALRARGCADIAVYSPSGRGNEFARARDLTVATNLAAALQSADLVVSCSGKGDHIVDSTTLADPGVRATPPVLLDLALSRDIDPAAARLRGIRVVNLETIKEHAPAVNSEPILAAHRIVAAGIERWSRWRSERAVREQLRAIVAAAQFEIERETRALADGLGDEVPARELERRAKAVRLEGKRSLHRQITRLKASASHAR